ncbi:MAG: alanine--tRNA ligase [Acidobacteriota bacterium]|nr:alanine--tRNA ligase [Acidobacteriota bacterium]
MNGNEVRRRFLEYFERNGHKIVHSSPLLPANDPTLLFTNAGMNQFKDVFLGNEKRDYTRAVSSQKCIRAGGKHNDLDEVGKTARHHTFFEMLGNFSFGDYFKRDAIRLAWDFLVNELNLEPQRLWFSYFGGDEEVPADEEARNLWIEVGAAPERVLPFGRKDNFWQMGDEGPCGPCSEIHYYMGEEPENPEKNHPKWVNGEGDTTMEIWNLVFMQFNRTGVGEKDASGKFTQFDLTPLPAPSVDTGAGLERMAAVLQGVLTNYDTDLILPIIQYTAGLAGKTYEYETTEGFAMRVVADHARATAFAIADGILPGNEGRNYVLRKIMRRAIYHGREHLGFSNLFFNQVCDFVVDQMKDAYPELEGQRDFIGKMVRLEEERFNSTMTVGAKKFEEQLGKLLGDVIEKELKEKLPDNEKNIFEETEKPLKKQSWQDLKEREKRPSETKRSYVFKKGTEEITRVEIEMSDGTVKTKNISELSEFEQQDLKAAETRLRETRESRRMLEQHRPVVEAMQRMSSSIEHSQRNYNNIKHLLEHQEKNRSLIEQYEKMRPQIEQILSQIDKIDLIKSLASLYDTYGYPTDLIRVGLRSYGFEIEEDEFDENFDVALQEIQQQSGIGKTQQKEKINPLYAGLAETIDSSEFRGYEVTTVENAKVAALIKDDERVEVLNEGDEGLIVLNETPFYAESGGQVGDTGILFNQNAHISVRDCFAPMGGIILHKSKIERGSIGVGNVVTASVDAEKRDATRRNHTATHLVHAALREVLGTHVKQAGSVVAPNYLRFDFTHYQALTESEIKEIEDLVNRYVLQNEPVNTDIMAIEDAMRTGAMALFGEKYGSKVRVLRIGGGEFSKELCGGTHVRATGDIGSFKITSDEAIASGVRRIRAITGFDAFERFREDEKLIEKSLGVLRTQRDQLPNAIERLQEELKRTRREVEDLKMKIATGAIGANSANGDETREINGVKVLAKAVEGLDSSAMRNLSDTLLSKLKSGVVVLGRKDDAKVSFIVRSSEDVKIKIPAGQIIKEIAPIVGGRGGGKPDMAEGGGNQPEKLDEALQASYGVIERLSQS